MLVADCVETVPGSTVDCEAAAESDEGEHVGSLSRSSSSYTDPAVMRDKMLSSRDDEMVRRSRDMKLKTMFRAMPSVIFGSRTV